MVKETKSKIEIANLHEGEKKAFALCKERKIKNILIDDKEGFNTALILDLLPLRTTSLLIIFLDKKLINFNEYKESLKKLSETSYFLDLSTYEKLLSIGKNLQK